MCCIGQHGKGLGEDPADDFDREEECAEDTGVSKSGEDIVRFCGVDFVGTEMIRCNQTLLSWRSVHFGFEKKGV